MYLDWYRLLPRSWAEEETFGAGAPELARGFLFQVSGLVGGVNFGCFCGFGCSGFLFRRFGMFCVRVLEYGT